MTRGKHGVSAAARHAVGERDKQIEAYQHNIRKLTAENAELKQKLADQQAAHSKTVRVLKAERDEGMSPMVSALQKENVKLKERLQHSAADLSAYFGEYEKAYGRIAGHFHSAHGLTKLNALEEAKKLLGYKDDVLVMPTDGRPLAKTDPSGMRAVQRARGQRG